MAKKKQEKIIKLTKRQQNFASLGVKESNSLVEALGILQKYRAMSAKFDESVDVVVKLGVDPRHSDQMVRGVVSMPAGTGKKKKVAVFTSPEKMDSLKGCGADILGSEDLVDQVLKGKIDFDVCVATPDFMPKLAKAGKILGTKGLMPNPKLGTVTNEVKETLESIKKGVVEYRTEKTGIVHAAIGKLSFEDEALKMNLKAFMAAIIEAKPSGAKGEYVKYIHLSPTMGPAIKLDKAELIA